MQESKRKILMLCGSHFQIPCIEYAKSAGYHVITCDRDTENSEQGSADECYSINTADLNAVLKLARKLKIDGIVAYALNTAVATAAYVAEKMGLPGNPYKSVKILSEKDLYRSFLRQNKFNTPWYGGFSTLDDFSNHSSQFTYPVLVKPVDFAGNNGISLVKDLWQMGKAIDYAMKFSKCKRFIVEDFIEKKYPQLSGDIFIYDGKIIAYYLGDQRNDTKNNPFIPSSINYPSLLPEELHEKIRLDLQRVIDKLKIRFGEFNIEVIVDGNDQIYLMEFWARNGDYCIPEIIKWARNLDLMKMSIDACMGVVPSVDRKEIDKFYSSCMIHSNKNGKFKELKLDQSISEYIIEFRLKVKKGDDVYKFTDSHCTVGVGLLKFPNEATRNRILDRIEKLIDVEVE